MYKENPELKLAYEFLQNTGENVFLTGKAGTGKTTFLHNFRRNAQKRMVVLAPTGVAALNARGVTIHSFFNCHLVLRFLLLQIIRILILRSEKNLPKINFIISIGKN